MTDDTAAAQGTATAPDATAQPQGQASAPATQPGVTKSGAGAHSAAQDAASLDAARLLADAVAAGDDGDGQLAAPGGEDPLKAAQAELAKWKAQARENEKRAKANADKARQYDAYTESQKTEQQRLADQLAAAQQEAQREREERLRLLAAASYDLPPSLVPHLGGGTEDEINERAETLAAAINERAAVLAAAQAQAASQQQQQPRSGAFRPVESLRPGALPASGSRPGDPNAWLRAAISARKQQ